MDGDFAEPVADSGVSMHDYPLAEMSLVHPAPQGDPLVGSPTISAET
jgi:hypothetical protein